MIRMVPMPRIRNFIFVVAANFIKLIYWIDDQVVFGGQMRYNYFFSALQIIFLFDFFKEMICKKRKIEYSNQHAAVQVIVEVLTN